MKRLAVCAGLLAACSLGEDWSSFTSDTVVVVVPAEAGVDAGAPSDAAAGVDVEAAAPCSAAGQMCPDGTVYAGAFSGGVLYTTPCDLGQTWAAAACTGERTTLPFNDGNGVGGVYVGAADFDDGLQNTLKLVAADSNSDQPGMQPHRAAQACADLVFGGHDDWMLPSANALEVMQKLAASKWPTFELGDRFYKTSTETHSAAEPFNAARLRFRDDYLYLDGDSKYVYELVRCVRYASTR